MNYKQPSKGKYNFIDQLIGKGLPFQGRDSSLPRGHVAKAQGSWRKLTTGEG